MLSDYFRDNVTVSHSTVTGNKTTYSTVATITAHIQPVEDSFSGGNAGRTGKSFMMFSTDEVRIGDHLLDQNGKKYEVYGVKFHKFRARRHYEASIRGV